MPMKYNWRTIGSQITMSSLIFNEFNVLSGGGGGAYLDDDCL